MTNLEALRSTINFPLPTSTLEKKLIDSDIDSKGLYSKQNEKGIDLCAIGLLFVIATTGDEKEADYALTGPSKDKITITYSYLTSKWGLPNELGTAKQEDQVPTISSPNVW